MREQRGGTSILYSTVAVVTGYGSLQFLLENVGHNFFARAGASVIAIGIGVAIWWFWDFLVRLAPTLKDNVARALVMVIAVLGLMLIGFASTVPNATAISGTSAQHTEIDIQIGTFEQATAKREETAHQLSGAVTDLDALVTKLDASAQAEFQRGAISGAGRQGAVFDLLTRLSGQLAGFRGALQQQQQNTQAALTKARADLAAMRGTSGRGLSPADRIKLVGASADALRSRLIAIDPRPLAASLTRLIEGLPHEIGGVALKLSDDPKIAARQREALTRLRGEFTETTKPLAALGHQLAAATPEDIPAFRAVTGSEAVILHWRSYPSTFAIALLLDFSPFAGFLLVLITSATKSRSQHAFDDLAGLSVQDLILSMSANDLLQGKSLDALRTLIAGEITRGKA